MDDAEAYDKYQREEEPAVAEQKVLFFVFFFWVLYTEMKRIHCEKNNYFLLSCFDAICFFTSSLFLHSLARYVCCKGCLIFPFRSFTIQ